MVAKPSSASGSIVYDDGSVVTFSLADGHAVSESENAEALAMSVQALHDLQMALFGDAEPFPPVPASLAVSAQPSDISGRTRGEQIAMERAVRDGLDFDRARLFVEVVAAYRQHPQALPTAGDDEIRDALYRLQHKGRARATSNGWVRR